ncbi:MAG: beta-lactamase family protein [Acidobacteria bacterium]|nr:beta-lactamase family protein [Acidobacteriota bacterium]
MSKRLLSFLLILALSHTLVLAQAKPAPAPQTVMAVDAGRLARLDGVLQEYVDKNQLAGIVALVLQDGKPVYERAFGWADKESGRKMTTDTIFRIASQTKALTSTAILILMEEGKLSVDDPVWRFIPTFRETKVAVKKDGVVEMVPAKRAITIRDLLTHTAGISYGTSSEVAALYEAKGLGPAAGFGWYTADKDEPVGVTMERLGTLPIVAQPGEAYVYGYNTDILGAVVEKASGMPLDQFIRERITQPLGMKDTQFFLPPAEKSRLATVYSSKDGQAVRAPEGSKGQGHYVDGPRKSFAGGAGLLSTAKDYARFLEMTRQGGTLDGVRVLSPRTVMLMRTNQSGTLHSQTGLGFGFGFQTTDRYGANGMDGVGAYGWGGAYGTNYRVDPESRLTLVLMIQQMPNSTDIQRKFSTLVYQSLINK